MRKVELAGLEWKDVNFSTRTVTVRERPRGRVSPKGRRVSIRFSGSEKCLGGPVFQAPEGGLLHNLGRVWAKVKSGVAHFPFHDLRHTAASRMVMAGVDLYQ